MSQNLSLLQALNMKMSWLGERQKLLAENIANADTPDYKPKDLSPLDFKSLLENSSSLHSIKPVLLAGTNPKHLASESSSKSSSILSVKEQKNTSETNPSGNAVDLEEQLLKMNQNFTDHSFVSNLYQKTVEMLRMSLK